MLGSASSVVVTMGTDDGTLTVTARSTTTGRSASPLPATTESAIDTFSAAAFDEVGV